MPFGYAAFNGLASCQRRDNALPEASSLGSRKRRKIARSRFPNAAAWIRYASRPELTKRPFFTHKRTYQERYAALGKASACVRSGLNPSIFSDGMCSTPQT